MLRLITKATLLCQGFGFGSNSIMNEVAAAKKFVDGGVFFDVGGNKGIYSKELLRAFGDKLKSIHCFEPSLELFTEYLKFDDPRVFVNNTALGSADGSGELFKVKDHSVLNSLTKRRLDHFNVAMTESESIKITTLDNYAHANQITKIDFLKIDVEGHELDVLHGGAKLLEGRAIECIQFEFGGCNIDTRTFFQDFWYLLVTEYKYSIYRITPLGVRRCDKYSELDEIFTTTNYLAVKNK